MTRLVTIALIVAIAAPAQLPPSQVLSPEDQKGVRAEIARLDLLAATAPDRCAAISEIARTWAYAGQYPETIAALRRVVGLNAGFDLARDKVFATLRGTGEFEALVKRARDASPPVLTSRGAFKIAEGDLVPENLAYDPARREFFFGSTTKHKIVRCSSTGVCQPFVAEGQDGLGSVLGLKVSPAARILWAVSDSAVETGLFEYRLSSGKLIRKFILTGTHALNDLVVTQAGDVFVTDTRAGTLYRLARTDEALQIFGTPAAFPFANGIALSPDQTRLYVSSFGDGISIVDPVSGAVHPIARPADVCLAWIDGLYAYQRSLIAIQNGPMTPRVVRFHLDRTGARVVRLEVLERRNPVFDGVTTGVIVGRNFYYMANTQDDKPAGSKFDPISVLKFP